MEYWYYKIGDVLYKRKAILESIQVINNRLENPVKYIPVIILGIALILVFLVIIIKYHL